MPNLLYFLAAYALCFGLISDRLLVTVPLQRLSFFKELFQCPYCTGFHCGWMVWLLHGFLEGFSQNWIPEILLWSFAMAAFCYITDVIVQWFEAKT